MAHHFIDGPAAGQLVSLTTPPILFRVGFNGESWEPIDENDEAKAENYQRLCVYIGLGPDKHFIGSSGERWFNRREGYRLLDCQPDGETLKDDQLWSAWCVANRNRILNEYMCGGPLDPLSVRGENPSTVNSGVVQRALKAVMRIFRPASK